MFRGSFQLFFKGSNGQGVVSALFSRLKWPGGRFSPFLRGEMARGSFQPFFNRYNGPGVVSALFRGVKLPGGRLSPFLMGEMARGSFQPFLNRSFVCMWWPSRGTVSFVCCIFVWTGILIPSSPSSMPRDPSDPRGAQPPLRSLPSAEAGNLFPSTLQNYLRPSRERAHAPTRPRARALMARRAARAYETG